jgi:hypothetical protein
MTNAKEAQSSNEKEKPSILIVCHFIIRHLDFVIASRIE